MMNKDKDTCLEYGMTISAGQSLPRRLRLPMNLRESLKKYHLGGIVVAALLSSAQPSDAASLKISSNASDPILGSAPVATNVRVAASADSAASAISSALVSETVWTNYSFNDSDGDPESGSAFVWQSRAIGSHEVDWSAIVTTRNFPVPSTLSGFHIRGCVEPRTDAATTSPSRGVQVCSTPIPVLAAHPVVTNVQVNLAPGDTEFIPGATLQGSYEWAEGQGGDISRYRWGIEGTTAAQLAFDGGFQTVLGEVPNLPITVAMAGTTRELSIMPVSDWGNTRGAIVTAVATENIIDPERTPIAALSIASFDRTQNAAVGATIPAGTYTLDYNGGYNGDSSRYEVKVGATSVLKGTISSNFGNIPSLVIPPGNVGEIEYIFTPVNGGAKAGDPISRTIGYLVDHTVRPVVTTISISTPSTLTVGEKIIGNVNINWGANPPKAEWSRYLWRHYKSDSISDKTQELNNSGLDRPASSVLERSLTQSDVGRVIELVFRAGIVWTSVNSDIASATTSGVVSGTTPSVVNPAALPTIDSVLVNDFSIYANSYGEYSLNPNGGYYIDVSEYEWRIIDVSGKMNPYTSGVRKVGEPGRLMDLQFATSGAFGGDLYPELTITPKVMSPDGTQVVTGSKVVIGKDDWKRMGYGLNRSGMIYQWGGATNGLHPQLLQSDITIVNTSGGLIYPGAILEAEYRAPQLSGTKDSARYTWQPGGANTVSGTVTNAGEVPVYQVKHSDVGTLISLRLQHCVSATVVPHRGEQLMSCADALTVTSSKLPAGGYVLEPLVTADLTVGSGADVHYYSYLPGSDPGGYHYWPNANSGCTGKGDGWRLPTVKELQKISAGAIVLPASWPKDHAYWTSEAHDSNERQTVYLENGNVMPMNSGSADTPGVVSTPAVCVKTL
ncbi:hypothetical protein [Aeromonas jandaei]|uniref:hypothetical protein n=1 Tax=Aeromonas jandaei TaxID=650 RepID=UPI003EC90589